MQVRLEKLHSLVKEITEIDEENEHNKELPKDLMEYAVTIMNNLESIRKNQHMFTDIESIGDYLEQVLPVLVAIKDLIFIHGSTSKSKMQAGFAFFRKKQKIKRDIEATEKELLNAMKGLEMPLRKTKLKKGNISKQWCMVEVSLRRAETIKVSNVSKCRRIY